MIISYPIMYYKSKIDMLMNFTKDLSVLGIEKNDLIEKIIQERNSCSNQNYTIIITKIIRKANNATQNNIS